MLFESFENRRLQHLHERSRLCILAKSTRSWQVFVGALKGVLMILCFGLCAGVYAGLCAGVSAGLCAGVSAGVVQLTGLQPMSCDEL